MGNLEVPNWLTNRGHTFTKTLSVVNKTVKNSQIATVCEEAKCPNRTECWSGGTATFMLMGDTCTRGCRFCAVKTSENPKPLNPFEPRNLAVALDDWDLDYIVLTSVDRDDLKDGGAGHLAQSIKEVHTRHPEIMIEILIPDFEGDIAALRTIVDSQPAVLAHNIETVQRLQLKVRDKRAGYKQSLFVLESIKKLNPKIYTKSSIMVGLGESDAEIYETMRDLRNVDVDFLTIGQYMRPSLRNLSVKAYVAPEKFLEYEKFGLEMGFKYVASGPLVRSSYKAGEYYIKNIIQSSL